MENIVISEKLAEDLFRFLGRQPCAGVFGMYAELATIAERFIDW